MTACQYLLVEVPLTDLSVLNDYGREGWRAVAVVGRGPDNFQLLMEKISVSDDLRPKPKPNPKKAA